MAEEQIKPGAIVQLRCGLGPVMVVQGPGVQEGLVRCSWGVGENICSTDLAPSGLRVVDGVLLDRGTTQHLDGIEQGLERLSAPEVRSLRDRLIRLTNKVYNRYMDLTIPADTHDPI